MPVHDPPGDGYNVFSPEQFVVGEDSPDNATPTALDRVTALSIR